MITGVSSSPVYTITLGEKSVKEWSCSFRYEAKKSSPLIEREHGESNLSLKEEEDKSNISQREKIDEKYISLMDTIRTSCSSKFRLVQIWHIAQWKWRNGKDGEINIDGLNLWDVGWTHLWDSVVNLESTTADKKEETVITITTTGLMFSESEIKILDLNRDTRPVD